MASIRDEIEEILVDSYGEYEHAASWECAFTEEVTVPFQANLLGIQVEVREFGANDNYVIQCKVLRQDKLKWVSVEDLDEGSLPKDSRHMIKLYIAWASGIF